MGLHFSDEEHVLDSRWADMNRLAEQRHQQREASDRRLQAVDQRRAIISGIAAILVFVGGAVKHAIDRARTGEESNQARLTVFEPHSKQVEILPPDPVALDAPTIADETVVDVFQE